MTAAGDFYDETYFKRQAPFGRIQGHANLFKFSDYISPAAKVVDFGCGGGFLLDAIAASEKVGVEINPVARECAKSLGITNVFPDTADIQNEWADVVISNHALEHVENPTAILREFFRILRKGGRIVVVTPYDSVAKQYVENDPDRHLFGWSPSNLGNLARACGFKIIESKEIRHSWPPKWHLIWQVLGPRSFHVLSRAYGFVKRSRTQVRLVAEKPNA